jgi:hypothetical protein
MLTAVKQCLAFWAFIRPCYICGVWHVLILAISPLPQSREGCSDSCWRQGVPRRLTEVLGVYYPQSAIPVKNGAWGLVTVLRYSDVSVNTTMYTLFNNIVSDTIHSVACVDFLGTQMTSLVLFLKLGVTQRIDWFTFVEGSRVVFERTSKEINSSITAKNITCCFTSKNNKGWYSDTLEPAASLRETSKA